MIKHGFPPAELAEVYEFMYGPEFVGKTVFDSEAIRVQKWGEHRTLCLHLAKHWGWKRAPWASYHYRRRRLAAD